MRRVSALALLLALACQDSDPPAAGGPPEGIAAGTPQVPPQGQPAMEAWLAAGHYKSWRCESMIFPARLNGVHGKHRICSNDALVAAVGATFPVGAASVKEMFYGPDNKPNGYAVGIKVAPGPGSTTWYWYERAGSLPTLRPVADSIAQPTCAGCHALASRDNVFLRAE